MSTQRIQPLPVRRLAYLSALRDLAVASQVQRDLTEARS